MPHQDRGHLRQGLPVQVPHLQGADHHPPGRGAGAPPFLPCEPAARPDGSPEKRSGAKVLYSPKPGKLYTTDQGFTRQLVLWWSWGNLLRQARKTKLKNTTTKFMTVEGKVS